MIERKCVICGKPFKCYPSDNKVTCSNACRRERQRRIAKEKPVQWSKAAKARASARGKTANLMLGTSAAQQSPIAGRFETNQEAKIWILIDPAGDEHTSCTICATGPANIQICLASLPVTNLLIK